MSLSAVFSQSGPQTLFSYFVEPKRLANWWAPHAQIEPWQGGTYCLSWPQMGWQLIGEYTTFIMGKELAFTWQWTHEPTLPSRTVNLQFVSQEQGCLLTIIHGTYTENQIDQNDRQNHYDGWNHFLTQLHQHFEQKV